jgi:hypothetical protein
MVKIELSNAVAWAIIFVCVATGLAQLKPYADSVANYFSGPATPGKKK